MDDHSLEDFVAQLGYSSYPQDEQKRKQYTDALITNLPEGQPHLFYVALNVGLPQSNVNPDQFSSREKYRQALITEKQTFLARELAPLRDLFEEMGVSYNKDHILRFLCLNLTKEQALGIRDHRLVKDFTAYHPGEPKMEIASSI